MSLPDYGAFGFKEIIVTLDGSVLVIVVNRAKHFNSFTKTIVPELLKVFELCDQDDRVRAVILTAEHTAPVYCSGADISGGWQVLWEADADKEGMHAHRDQGGQIAIAILRCRKITIAAVNGHAVGVGVTALQLPFDFRFVWAGAKLALPFIRRGIAPEAISSYLLPRLIGHSRANSLLLTGSTFTPDSPYVQGLYHKVLPTREAVFPAALEFAKELASSTSQVGVAYTKALLQHPGNSIEENHILDSKIIRLLGSTNDGQEGVKSFKEKRAPKFTDTLSKHPSWEPWWYNVDIKHHKTKL